MARLNASGGVPSSGRTVSTAAVGVLGSFVGWRLSEKVEIEDASANRNSASLPAEVAPDGVLMATCTCGMSERRSPSSGVWMPSSVRTWSTAAVGEGGQSWSW